MSDLNHDFATWPRIIMGHQEYNVIDDQIDIRNEILLDESKGFEKYNGGMIKSVRPASKINKKNEYFYNLSIPTKILMRDDFDFYMELISLARNNKSQSRLFVYGRDLLEFMHTPMCKALKKVFTIIPIWPSVTPPPTPGPSPPTPGPSDYNLIPSNVKGDCRPTLIIRPDECNSEMGNQNYHRWLEGNNRMVEGNGTRSYQDPRIIFYGLVLQPWLEPSEDPYSLELVRHFFEIEECFDDILERAIEAAYNCLHNSDGEMNQNIIVQVKQKTVDNGFLKSPSYKRFKREINNFNRRWNHVNGVVLSVQII